MSAEQYAKHVEVVKKAFHRAGVDISGAGEVELNSLGTLETILRVSSPEGKVLSDMPKGAYSADFYDELRKAFFRDYLDYRKTYLELSLDEYIGERYGLPKAIESVDASFVDPNELDYDEEIFPEDLVDSGLVLFTLPSGVDDEGYDIWTDPERAALVAEAEAKEESFRALDLGEFSIDLIMAPMAVKGGVKGTLAFDPMGIDSEGYDLWHDTAYDGEEIDLNEAIASESKGFEEVVEEVVEEPSGPYGVYDGEDSDGYDVWSAAAVEEVIVVEEPIAEVVKAEEKVAVGNWQGIDELGYDIWTTSEVKEEPNTFDDEGDSDGFDHSADPERDSLGELHSKWIGEDSKGYDLWESGDGVEPSIADVSSEEEELKSPHYGTDNSGFDIWVSPVAPSSTANVSSSGAVSSTSTSPNTSTMPMNEVTYTNASGGEPIVIQAPLSREDQLLSSVDQAISGIFQFSKRITGSNSRRNSARNR